MKITNLRNALYAALLVAGVSFTSCKKDADKVDADAAGTENYESPMDTVVTDNDTIIESGTDKDASENPVGTQVP